MTSTPHNLRSVIAFSLNLADSLGITVEGINATDYGTVSLYAWDQGADAIDEIADRDGWPAEPLSGEKWRGRRRTFDVDDRPVQIDVIGRTAVTAEVPA